MRKFIIAAMVASLVFLTSFSAPADTLHNAVFTVGQSKYIVDGLAKQMDGAAFLQQPQDRVFVPVRYLAYSLGLTDSGITWDQTSQMAILVMGNTTVVLSPKEKTYYINGQANQMDTLPLIKSGRLYLPARYVAQAFGYSVSWDQATDSVIIGPAQSSSSSNTQTSGLAEYNMQIVPVPSSAQAGQAVQLDISVTGTDNQAASGVTLVLTGNSSTATLSPAEVVTNSSGQGVVTATDNAAETVTFTATVLNSNTTATASVQWIQSSTLTGNYTVHLSSSTTSATEGEPVVFTATVDNSAGSPVSGAGVTIASSSANAVLSAASLVTNAQGQAFFTATDNSAENVTFTATPTGGGSAQTTSVTWSAPPNTPSYTSYATTPSLQISSTATTAAVGQPVEYTVTATGSYGVAAGTILTVTGSSANAQPSSTTLSTNNAGQAFFTTTDNVAESATFTVRMASNTAVMNSATTQWVNSYTSTQTTTATGSYYLDFSASNNSATEGQPVVFTVTVGNNTGTPVSGTGVSIASTSANAVLSATNLVTNAQGQAFFTAIDNSPETVAFTATPTGGGSAQTASVLWSAPPSTPNYTSYATTPSLQMSSTAATAALGQPVVYTVTATGNYGPAPNATLVVTGNSTNAILSSTILTTNSEGKAYFTATDSLAESVTFTVRMASATSVMATGTTQWLNSYAQPSNLLNNAPIYELGMSPSPATAAVGEPVILNLTVVDNNNQLASGIGISLISSSGNARLSSNYVTTDSQGHAFVTVTDNAAENVTFTASLANVTSRQPYVTTSVQWSGQAGNATGYNNSQVAVSGYYATLSESTTSMHTGQPVVLTVTVTDSSNHPVSGLNVLVSSASSNVQLTETNSVTNSQGQVFITAVDNTAESVTFTIQLETNGSYGSPVSAGTLQWY